MQHDLRRLAWDEFIGTLKVQFSISEQLHYRIVQRFQGGLVFQADRLVYHSTLGSRVMKKKKRPAPPGAAWRGTNSSAPSRYPLPSRQETLQNISSFFPASRGYNLASTVLYVPCSLDSGQDWMQPDLHCLVWDKFIRTLKVPDPHLSTLNPEPYNRDRFRAKREHLDRF